MDSGQLKTYLGVTDCVLRRWGPDDMIPRMLWDVVPFRKIWRTLKPDSVLTEATVAFVNLLEQKTGASFVFNKGQIPFNKANLIDLAELSERLRKAGTLRFIMPATLFTDEPPLYYWRSRYREGDEGVSGGSHLYDERIALICTLAEATERYIWFEKRDYFKKPEIARVNEISRSRNILSPGRFVGVSDTVRSQHTHMTLDEEAAYLWIEGYSWIHEAPILLPAQTISAHPDVRARIHTKIEPFIRYAVTTGLATHSDRSSALLGGAMEIIERDAYMIMWLNELSLPRIHLNPLADANNELKAALALCARYRLVPHALQLLTDAPAHAICIVLEDQTGCAPRFAIGLKAHRDPVAAILGALNEALRARRAARMATYSTSDTTLPVAHTIGHHDRIAYWAHPENAPKLEFLIRGPEITHVEKPWESDSAPEHLDRIISWCKDSKYEFTSVSFTKSRANVTPWHIEMVVIPELQPIYYSESMPHSGGTRLQTIPALYGYPVRSSFYTNEPHPFA